MTAGLPGCAPSADGERVDGGRATRTTTLPWRPRRRFIPTIRTTPWRADFDHAMEKLQRELPGSAVNTPLVLERIAGMGLRWGTSDGN
jgi:hypothetical protein